MPLPPINVGEHDKDQAYLRTGRLALPAYAICLYRDRRPIRTGPGSAHHLPRASRPLRLGETTKSERPPPGALSGPSVGPITRHAFQSLLRQHGVQRSLSAKGNGFDNAAMESFFALLKRERVTRQRYLTRKQARTDIFDDIERFYNRQRPHPFTGGLSPLESESRALN